MRATTLALTPSFKRSAMLLVAGAALLAATGAQADPRHGGGRDRNHRGGWNKGHHYSHGHHRGHHYRGHSHNRSSFSFNYIVSPRPYYTRSYYPQPVNYNYYYTPQPVSYAPIQYTTPASTYDDGRYCREYTRDVVVGGRMQQSYGRACMQPDGAWEIDS